jgi:hypothetical protein
MYVGSRERQAADMRPSLPADVRIAAGAAPVLLFAYGVLRLIDGLDGHHGPGLPWNVGHTLFLAAIVLLVVLGLGLRRVLRPRPGAPRWIADLSVVATVLGAIPFLWVTLTDLFRRLPHLDGPLKNGGPALFEVGLFGLLVLLAAQRRLPFWTPALVLIGFLAIPINLDLIPVAAVIVAVGLLPLSFGHKDAPVSV